MSKDIGCTVYPKNEQQPWILLTEVTHAMSTVKRTLDSKLSVFKYDENMKKIGIATDSTELQQKSENPRRCTPLEILSHRTTTDMWIIIDGEVFDVTLFQHEHPGGAKSMSFQSRIQPRTHSISFAKRCGQRRDKKVRPASQACSS